MQDTTSLLTSQIAAAAACSYLLNLLQKWSKTPWITAHTPTINLAVRALLAFAATVGIGIAWAGTAGEGHTLTITIPSTFVLLHGLWNWFSQYALTHLAGSALEKAAPAKDASSAS